MTDIETITALSNADKLTVRRTLSSALKNFGLSWAWIRTDVENGDLTCREISGMLNAVAMFDETVRENLNRIAREIFAPAAA